MGELLRLDQVTLRNQEGRAVFQALDWSLPRGGRVHFQGTSGQGASAFLRLCAGLAHPQEGTVFLDGRPLGPYTFDHPFLKRGGIGWVPTGGGLLANLDLRANVALPLRFLRGHSRSQALEIAQEHLERADLGALVDLRPHALEPRDRWLGALVRAAVSAPELWLLDQPPEGMNHLPDCVEAILKGAAANPGTAFLVVGSRLWSGVEQEVVHLEQGRIVPGGL